MISKSSKRSVVLLAALGVTILSTAGAALASERWTYVGCYADQPTRDLPIQVGGDHNPKMTHDLCSSLCTAAGVRYFSVQDSNQCFCGDSYGSYGTSAACNLTCSGDHGEICGGSWANSVYESTAKAK